MVARGVVASALSPLCHLLTRSAVQPSQLALCTTWWQSFGRVRPQSGRLLHTGRQLGRIERGHRVASSRRPPRPPRPASNRACSVRVVLATDSDPWGSAFSLPVAPTPSLASTTPSISSLTGGGLPASLISRRCRHRRRVCPRFQLTLARLVPAALVAFPAVVGRLVERLPITAAPAVASPACLRRRRLKREARRNGASTRRRRGGGTGTTRGRARQGGIRRLGNSRRRCFNVRWRQASVYMNLECLARR